MSTARRAAPHALRTPALAAAALVLAAPAAAAQVGRAVGGGMGMSVWSDANFRGASATLQQAEPDLARIGLSGTISSFRMPEGELWEGCDQPYFRGRCQTFSGEERDLKPTGWNDRLRSLRPLRTAGGGYPGGGYPGGGYPPPVYPPAPARGALVLYAEPNFRGAQVAVSGDIADLGRVGFDDRAESARAQGVWELCTGRGFRQCQRFSGDVRDLAPYRMAANVSSVRPLGGGGPAPVRPDPAPTPIPTPVPGPGGGDGARIRVYLGTNGQGPSREFAGAVRDVGMIMTGSVIPVGAGRWQLCSEPDFRGTCVVTQVAVTSVRGLGFARVRSLRPM